MIFEYIYLALNQAHNKVMQEIRDMEKAAASERSAFDKANAELDAAERMVKADRQLKALQAKADQYQAKIEAKEDFDSIPCVRNPDCGCDCGCQPVANIKPVSQAEHELLKEMVNRISEPTPKPTAPLPDVEAERRATDILIVEIGVRIDRLRHMTKSRERSLALTKLQEAHSWLELDLVELHKL